MMQGGNAIPMAMMVMARMSKMDGMAVGGDGDGDDHANEDVFVGNECTHSEGLRVSKSFVSFF